MIKNNFKPEMFMHLNVFSEYSKFSKTIILCSLERGLVKSDSIGLENKNRRCYIGLLGYDFHFEVSSKHDECHFGFPSYKKYVFGFTSDKTGIEMTYRAGVTELAAIVEEIDFQLLAGKKITADAYEFYRYCINQAFSEDQEDIKFIEFKKHYAKNFNNQIYYRKDLNTIVPFENIVKKICD